MLSRLDLLQELKKLEKISVNKQREDYVKLKKKIFPWRLPQLPSDSTTPNHRYGWCGGNLYDV